METISFNPIGVFRSEQKHKMDTGRQPNDELSHGHIELFAGSNFEQALIGLEGVERIWVLFTFHLNSHWNPMVTPPRGTDEKIGVFATRAPYRPNPIGMSCLVIDKIEGRKIYLKNSDILDSSPILDIKPYLPYADSWPESRVAWLEEGERTRFQVSLSPHVQSQLEWLKQQGVTQLKAFIMTQLEFDPTNEKKKRVKSKDGFFEIAYRTWRIDFLLAENKIGVLGVRSGYSADELNQAEDTYQDKPTHRSFIARFENEQN